MDEVSEDKSLEKKQERGVSIPDNLGELVRMGMSMVDPADIRPPSILLTQKSTDFDMLQDKAGRTPDVGVFFHTGKMESYEDFDSYFVFAAKQTYTDTREDPPEEKEQYFATGVLKDDMSLFSMLFRGSARWALNQLFTAATSREIPMFALECKVETKQLSNEKGTWYIPVVRVGKRVEDEERLKELYMRAKQFSDHAEKFSEFDPEEEEDNKEPF